MFNKDVPGESFGEDSAVKAQFEALLDGNETRDAGILNFEAKMNDIAEVLTEKWAGNEIVPTEVLSQAATQLNELWHNTGEIATLTGRVYVATSDSNNVPAEGFEELELIENQPQNERKDKEYSNEIGYYVDSVKFISQGVDLSFSEENGVIQEVSVRYRFSLLSDEVNEVSFTAKASDLFIHHYEEISNAEAAVRLERKWPEHFGIIESLIEPQHTMRMIKRLKYAAHRFEKDFAESSEFQELLTQYINGALEFDMSHPYMIKAHSYVDAFDGDDVSSINNYADWQQINLADPITLLGYRPQVVFTHTTQENYIAQIIIEVFNEEDASEPEYIAIPAENIISFRGTKALRSLLSSALLLNGVYSHDSENSISELTDEISTLHPEVAGIEVFEEKNIASPYVQAMELAEQTFEEIQNEARIACQKIYPTQELAQEASEKFYREFIMPRLAGIDMTMNYEYIISGKKILYSNDSPRPQNLLPSEFYMGVKTDEPLLELDPRDSMRVILYSISPKTIERKDVTGEIRGYSILPLLRGHYNSYTIPFLTYDDLSVRDINVEDRAIMPLDGTTTIKVAALQEYNKEIQAIEHAAYSYRNEPIMESIYKLHQALYGQQLGNRSLKNVHLISTFTDGLAELEARGKDPLPARDAFETLMTGRHVTVTGGVLTNLPDGTKKYESSETVTGEIVDVLKNEITEELAFVMKVSGQFKHVSISTITAVRF